MRLAVALLLLATVATAHVPDHLALSCMGATGGYLLLAKVCRVDREPAMWLALTGMGAAGLVKEFVLDDEPNPLDLAANALGLIAAGMIWNTL
jgi:hypothetical protein